MSNPTYQIPTKNMAEIASLRLSGIFNVQTAGSGRMRRKKSVVTLPTPWITTSIRVRVHVSETKAARKSSWEVPVEGAHMAAKAMTNERWKATTTTMPAIEAIRIHFKTLKICKYRIRTEILTKQIANGKITSTRRESLVVSLSDRSRE